MDYFRRSWAQIRAWLEELTPSTRWLMASLAVILLLTGFLVVQYAAAPPMTPITPFAEVNRPELVQRLQAAGLDVKSEGEQILVPASQRIRAMSVMAQSDLMRRDTSSAFGELVQNQSYWWNNRQSAQAFLYAKMSVLSEILGKMQGVQSADVVVSMPEQRGFGQTHTRPSASVTILMERERSINPRMVEAIAGLVAGAVAEMRPEDVTVIDAGRGRSHTVRDEQSMLAGDQLERVRTMEREYRRTIEEVLGYIPGVIVAVKAQVGNVVSRQVEEIAYQESEPLKSELTEERNSRSAAEAGQPGVRPNTGMSIEGGSGPTTKESESRRRTDFNEQKVTQRSRTQLRGGTTQQVNVTINVPRSYLKQVYERVAAGVAGAGEGEAPAAPAAEDEGEAADDSDGLEQWIPEELQRIEQQVRPLVLAEAEGVVRAHQIPDATTLMGESRGEVSTIAAWLGSEWGGTITAALMVLLSTGLLFYMVQKSTQSEELPSAQELAGVPPALPGDDELVGEAEEVEAGMAGFELGEEEMEAKRMADQISELVKSNPDEATAIFKRWLHSED